MHCLLPCISCLIPVILVTSLYIQDIILVLFSCITKQDFKRIYLVTGDGSQSVFTLEYAKG